MPGLAKGTTLPSPLANAVSPSRRGRRAGHNVTHPSWKLWRAGDSWYLVKATGTTVIFR